ncbi:MAG: glycosyltransferase family 4 protein, partial [Calditrichaeota bacterium]|nr:glycosyltransferase family 4 protein [Calditrichota bacterium]
NHTPLRLIHAGLLEPADRDPEPFFYAIKKIVQKEYWKGTFQVDLIAPGNYEAYRQKVDELALADYIRILPPVPYQQALQKMADADILLLFQGKSCNEQIPAKAYEYLRIGKPVFALTPAESETAKLISETKAGIIVSPDHPERIADSLINWLELLKKGKSVEKPSIDVAANYSRKHQTFKLASCIKNVLKEK